MNITIKQLLDIVSLSIEAVNMKADPTVPSHTENFFYNGNSTALVTAVENESCDILSNNGHCDLERRIEAIKFSKALNEHIAAIRLGMRLNQQSEEE